MKVLFSDFDGTLVEGNKELSQKNKEMMKRLQDEGHLMVICTGRNIKEFQKDQQVFHFPFDYLVLNNGGHIVDKNYQTLYEKVIDQQVGIDILDHSTSYPHMWSYFCDGKETYAYKDGITYDHSIGDVPIDKDFISLYHHAHHFQILCFNQDDAGMQDTKVCYNYVQEHYQNEVEAYFNLHYVDVVPYGCSKGTGIHQLLKLLKQDIEEVYAIGDSYNDLSMIQEATHGYTFHHAHEDIRQATKRYVHFVYEVIEDMLGGQQDELAR